MNNTVLSNTNQLNITQDSYLKLCEYGSFSHRKGNQIINKEAAQTMVKNFNSLKNKVLRKFAGVPIFIGHPDDPDFKKEPGHQDTRAYAWVVDLQAREDGLYIKPKWSFEGKKIIDNAFYKYLSARWLINPTTNQPEKLISIGLTNHPNIPGDTIANQKLHTSNSIIPDLKPLKTTSITDNLTQHKSPQLFSNQFINLVKDQMHKTNSDFLSAWTNVKQQNPNLYEFM